MPSSTIRASAASLAFDTLAEEYDRVFTTSLIGRAQREAVWDVLDRTFPAGANVLELNCGTGEDDLHIAQRGMTVVACDASSRMVEVACRKVGAERFGGRVSFHQVDTERLHEIAYRAPFDGVLSNFAGLNCVEDLADVADQLARLVRPDGFLLLCLCSRFCLWEILYFGLQLRWGQALRRCRGYAQVQVRGVRVDLQYPTVHELKRTFSPWFTLREARAVGLTIPPSYLEAWASRHPSCFRFLVRLDKLIRALPGLRVLGDHVLLTFQRCEI